MATKKFDFRALVKKAYQESEAWHLLVTGFILIIAIHFFTASLALNNRKQRVRNLNQNQSELIKKIGTINKEIKFFSEITKQTLNEGKHKQALINGYSEGNLNSLLKKLIASISAYNLKMVSLENKELEKTKEGFQKAKVTILLQGSYKELGEYLFFLEEIPILAVYNHVIISHGNEGLDMKLDLDIIYW